MNVETWGCCGGLAWRSSQWRGWGQPGSYGGWGCFSSWSHPTWQEVELPLMRPLAAAGGSDAGGWWWTCPLCPTAPWGGKHNRYMLPASNNEYTAKMYIHVYIIICDFSPLWFSHKAFHTQPSREKDFSTGYPAAGCIFNDTFVIPQMSTVCRNDQMFAWAKNNI